MREGWQVSDFLEVHGFTSLLSFLETIALLGSIACFSTTFGIFLDNGSRFQVYKPFNALWCPGSGRCDKLLKAALANKPAPPMELRYLKQGRAKVAGDSACARVTSFLEGLYTSVAETLPDIKDEGVLTQLHDAPDVLQDSYADSLSGLQPDAPAQTGLKRRNSRKRKMSLEVHKDRHPSTSGLEVRFLPPGTMKDHWETMRAHDAGEQVSFKTFWKTWHTEFSHLRFRAASMHVQCSVCLHHKMLIRELSQHLNARTRQSELYSEHLVAQYRDRQKYWQARGISRLQFETYLVVMIDGMDQCKFQYPRSAVCRAKDLASLQRPRLQVTGVLAHGFGLFFAASGHDHPKDASASVELLAYLISRLRDARVNLGRLHLHVQCDNTVRELKNCTTMRFLSALVGAGVLKAATMAHLRSGHSHEDLDQIFGSLALYLVKNSRQAETPQDFKEIMQRFADGAQRPYEKVRCVVHLDQHRDWKFGSKCGTFQLRMRELRSQIGVHPGLCGKAWMNIDLRQHFSHTGHKRTIPKSGLWCCWV